MKKTLLSLFCVTLLVWVNAQNLKKPSAYEIATLPQWAQLMYADQANLLEVTAAYNAFYKENLLNVIFWMEW